MSEEKVGKRFKASVQEIISYLNLNVELLNATSLHEFIALIINTHRSENRVFIYGAGRSGFLGRCFAQRLMHLGINSCFVSDAVTYRYTKEDLLILISGSGETTSPVAIAREARKIDGKIVLLTGNPESTIGKISTLSLKIQGKSKDIAIEKETLAPYTSLFDISTLALLDSVGGILMDQLGVSEEDIDKRHASIE